MRVLKALPLLTMLFTAFAWGQVTYDRILHSDKEPQNWLTYGGDYGSNKYSLLTQINRTNVKNLQMKWVWHPKSLDKMEDTPLVVDGVMYVVQGNEVAALDAATGRKFWTFGYQIPPESNGYLMVVKGLAVSGHTVFWATYDGFLIAIDARNGQQIWKKMIVDWKVGYQLNMAPLIIKDMVVLGPATNERGANCWVAAYDVKTGEERWRFWTAPTSPSDPIAKTWGNNTGQYGGNPIWVTGSYDPESNLTYWGTGNPNPGWNGDPREGDNLYGDSVVALDADTGKLKWYYQFSPHDERDYDSVQVPVLTNLQWHGKERKVMLWANRNGMFYVIDRLTGEVLLGKPFVKQNWNIGLDKNGRPIPDPKTTPKPVGLSWTEPATQGGTNWYSPSYSPHTGLFYVSTWANYNGYTVKSSTSPKWALNQRYTGSALTDKERAEAGSKLRRIPAAYRKEEEGFGAIRAIDPITGEKKWDFKEKDWNESGLLSTASDLVFGGGEDGNFVALDAKTGELLWHVGVGGTVAGGAITYMTNGHQYVAAPGEGVMYVFGLPE